MVDWGYSLGLLEVQSNASLAFRDVISQRGYSLPACARLPVCRQCNRLLAVALRFGAPNHALLTHCCMHACACLPSVRRWCVQIQGTAQREWRHCLRRLRVLWCGPP
jgi:hypothetical protein